MNDLNKMIIDKIDKSKYPDEVKEFINQTLYLEFLKSHEGQARYKFSEKLDELIGKYSSNWSGEIDED